MKIRLSSFTVLAVAGIIAPCVQPVQAQRAAAAAQRRRSPQAPRLRSPEVHPNRTVTFRVRSSSPKQVRLELEGAAPRDLTRTADDTWAVTVGPLAPDFYSYGFRVDGTAVMDSANPLIKPGLLGIRSMVHIPGQQLWDRQKVPHGVVHHHFYDSRIVGDRRDYYVYTPPGYSPDSRARYPVLYLLHGYSDDASGWLAVGQANVILDNLIAAHRAKPMILVMPLGYGAPEVLTSGFTGPHIGELFRKNNDLFVASLIREVMPAVERQYRVKRGRRSTAIAGLSMGGGESLSAGLNHPELFGYVVGLSSAIMLLGSRVDSAFPAIAAGHEPSPLLLWIACGKSDGLLKGNQDFEKWLKSKRVRFQAVETPGAHSWFVWRRNLAAFAPLLFSHR